MGDSLSHLNDLLSQSIQEHRSPNEKIATLKLFFFAAVVALSFVHLIITYYNYYYCYYYYYYMAVKRKDASLNKILTRRNRVACHYHSLK